MASAEEQQKRAVITNSSSNNVKAAGRQMSVTSRADIVETGAEMKVISGSNVLLHDDLDLPQIHFINLPTPPYSPLLLNSPLPFSSLHPNLPSSIYLSG